MSHLRTVVGIAREHKMKSILSEYRRNDFESQALPCLWSRWSNNLHSLYILAMPPDELKKGSLPSIANTMLWSSFYLFYLLKWWCLWLLRLLGVFSFVFATLLTIVVLLSSYLQQLQCFLYSTKLQNFDSIFQKSVFSPSNNLALKFYQVVYKIIFFLIVLHNVTHTGFNNNERLFINVIF